MKVIVTELDKDVLSKMIIIYKLESEICFLDETQLSDDCDNCNSNQKSFYIEENIKDFDGLFSLRYDEEYRNSPFSWLLGWREFEGFWSLILKIRRLKEFDDQMSDVEYVYKRGKQLNLQIELTRASVELGFYPDLNYFVIIGESEFGKMILFQDEGETEFVFSVEYIKQTRITKKKKIKCTHWHPSDYMQALEDMIAFMNNDKEYLKCWKLWIR